MDDLLCKKCFCLISVNHPTCDHSLAKYVEKRFSKDFKVLKKVLNHLKLYGYEISFEEFGKDIIFNAYHKTKLTFAIIYVKYGFLFNTRFVLDKNKFQQRQEEIYKTVNEMNRIPDIVSFTIDKGDFVAVAWYPNYYTKSTFDVFLELFDEEVQLALRTHNDFLDIIRIKN